MENEKLVIDAITVLANKLGTTGTHLWEVLVRQAPISSLIDLSTFLITCIFIFFTTKNSIRCFKKYEKDDVDVLLGVSVFLMLMSFVFTMICLAQLWDASNWLSGLYNPEYWALQNVMSSFK